MLVFIGNCRPQYASKTVSQMCQIAGITGFKTNHSSRVTAATRLFQAGVNEQLIMKGTRKQSVDGVRKYKQNET